MFPAPAGINLCLRHERSPAFRVPRASGDKPTWSWVLVVGQGGEADNQEIAMLAEKLGAEVGYSRARVMNGGVDAEKVIGISGHLLAPEVCIVVGASGAAALMAGVRNSKFVVAINHDASAAVFSQADVGVVDDWKVVLEALVTNIHADCQ